MLISWFKIQKNLILVALPAIMWLYYNQAANWHYHITSHGIYIEHAHPFQKNTSAGSQFPNHTHTDLEYSILAQISQPVFIWGIVAALSILIRMLIQTFRADIGSVYLPFHQGLSLGLRAPPLR